MRRLPLPLRPPRAFTLIEVLVVVAVIALLMALAVPLFMRITQTGQATACLSNLRQIGAGLNGYLAEHDFTMPALQAGRSQLAQEIPVLDTALQPYVRSKAVFACPADPHFARDTGTSYFWNVALNNQRLGSLSFLQITEEQSKIPVLSDKEGFHPYTKDKVNILYADGHATKDLNFTTK